MPGQELQHVEGVPAVRHEHATQLAEVRECVRCVAHPLGQIREVHKERAEVLLDHAEVVSGLAVVDHELDKLKPVRQAAVLRKEFHRHRARQLQEARDRRRKGMVEVREAFQGCLLQRPRDDAEVTVVTLGWGRVRDLQKPQQQSPRGESTLDHNLSHREVVEKLQVWVGEAACVGLCDLLTVVGVDDQRPVVVPLREVDMLGRESDHLLAHRPRRLESDDLLPVETEALVISVLERVLQSVHRRQRRCDVPRRRDILVEVEGPSDREVDVVSRHDHKLLVCCVLGKASKAECVVDVAADAHIESELAREPQALRC